uniref:F-box domain-containing protein n=1 Tax=Chenopodium quinoa TaxID=63459 RepID=A0A803MFU2_CHEQI
MVESPEELIGKIAGHLKFHGSDHRRFRAVCRKWRNSSSPSTQFLISDFPLEIPSVSGGPNFLISSVVYILYNPLSEKIKPWVVSIEEFDKLKIRHPITSIINVNSNFPKSLNFLDFGLRIVDFRVNLRFTKSVEDVFSSKNSRLKYWENYPIKTNSVLLNFSGVVVILLLYLRGALGIVKLNEEWKLMEFCPDCLFDDIVKFKGGVCAISTAGITWLINDFQGKGCPGSFGQKLCKFPSDLSITEFNQRRRRLAFCMEEEEIDSCDHISSKSSSVEQSISAFSQHGKNEHQGVEDLSTSLCQMDTALKEASCANNDKTAPAINTPCQISKSGAIEENSQRTDVSLNLAPHISGNSLNNSQAEYLNFTLADLQMMKIRLDWLVPFVERALAVHKSKCQKAIIIAEVLKLEEQMIQQEKLMAESPDNKLCTISLGEGLS